MLVEDQNAFNVPLPSIIIADQAHQHLEELTNALSTAQYRIAVVASAQEVQVVMADEAPQAILLTAATDLSSTLRVIQDSAIHARLILVVSSDASWKSVETIAETIDLIVSLESPFWQSQIRSYLSLDAENHLLSEQLRATAESIPAHQRKFDELELLKNAIVRNVSHELRTPLLQVKSAVSLILESVNDDSNSLVSFAETSLARLQMTINNITMLGYSLTIDLSPNLLRDAVEQARRNVGRVIGKKKEAARIEVHLEDGLPLILADRQALSTVLQSLMDNALKFSEESIQVIGKRYDDKYVYVAVRDHGIGIHADKLDRVFDEFWQLDPSNTRPYGGTGVGLALVKLILERHNTMPQVTSIPGEGSTFWFLLPVVPTEEDR